jgi:hypothetical protein
LQIHRFASLAFMGFLPLLATLLRRLSPSGPLRLPVHPNSATTRPIYARFSFAVAFQPTPSGDCGCARLMPAIAALQAYDAHLYEPREIASRSHFGKSGRCIGF